MITQKIDRETFDTLAELDTVRKAKNVATKSEKELKTRLALPDAETGLMFAGKLVAVQTASDRNSIDLELLKSEFPKAFEACQKTTSVYTLKIML